MESILGQYLSFLRTTQGLADATLVLRRLHLEPFLRSLEAADTAYGVRIGQAIHLRLCDIDWHQELIYFPTEKGCKPLSFPILPEVAEALLSYLRERGAAPGFDEVFLTVRGAWHPLGVHNHLGSALKSYYRRAGLRATRCGAHPIRHAFATRLNMERLSKTLPTCSDIGASKPRSCTPRWTWSGCT